MQRRVPTPAIAEVKISWSATPYFDPSSKYIWDIVLDNAGTLYVATGDRGEIYKVNAAGQNSLFFKSDEVHIRVLAVDPEGNLIAGSDGSGLVYRIAPNGEAFVLYSAPQKGNYRASHRPRRQYLCISGRREAWRCWNCKRRGQPWARNDANLSCTSGNTNVTTAPTASSSSSASSSSPTSSFPAPGMGATGGSEIYRIAPDGAPQRWVELS